MEYCGRILQNRAGYGLKYGPCGWQAEYLRLQMHTLNMQYLLLFHRNSGCKNAL
jgi:hypothetical protein